MSDQLAQGISGLRLSPDRRALKRDRTMDERDGEALAHVKERRQAWPVRVHRSANGKATASGASESVSSPGWMTNPFSDSP